MGLNRYCFTASRAADDRIEGAEHTEVLMFPSQCGSTLPTLSETRRCKDG
jgi:hypothetical protein